MIEQAKLIQNPQKLSRKCKSSEVSSVLITSKGNLFYGLSIDTLCGLGFCAEQSAIASMIAHGESQIKKIIALSKEGKILPPCGRCREFMFQINHDNLKTKIIIAEKKIVSLEELLPHRWQEYKFH